MAEIIWGSVGLLLTVMVLSYLIGDNVLFKFAAHVFIGLTAGYLVVLIINQILVPLMVEPMIAGSNIERLWLAIPIVLVALLLLGQLPRFSGVSSLPLAFLAGLTAAIAIGGAVFGTLIPQSLVVVEAFDPAQWYADPSRTWLRILEAVVMLAGVVGTLSYFHFGRKRAPANAIEETQRPRVFEALGKVGQVFIGITLGAVFAGLFSSALFALIDRIIFIREMIVLLIGAS
mgnify:CR=1 FL=1